MCAQACVCNWHLSVTFVCVRSCLCVRGRARAQSFLLQQHLHSSQTSLHCLFCISPTLNTLPGREQPNLLTPHNVLCVVFAQSEPFRHITIFTPNYPDGAVRHCLEGLKQVLQMQPPDIFQCMRCLNGLKVLPFPVLMPQVAWGLGAEDMSRGRPKQEKEVFSLQYLRDRNQWKQSVCAVRVARRKRPQANFQADG